MTLQSTPGRVQWLFAVVKRKCYKFVVFFGGWEGGGGGKRF